MKNRKILWLFCFLFLVSSLLAEEIEPKISEEQKIEEYFGDYDPWEPVNRRVYYFNYGFDKYVFRPIVNTYQVITPDFVENRVSHFFDNTKNVSILGNSMLQRKGRKSMRSLARLSINTILGLGGLFDVASLLGMPQPYEDFGLTLAHYGVPRGPYVVLPLLGPSYLRDTVGMAVDTQALKGLKFYDQDWPKLSLSTIDKKSRNSFEFYSTNSPFEYEYIRFLHKKYRSIQEETHNKLNIGGV